MGERGKVLVRVARLNGDEGGLAQGLAVQLGHHQRGGVAVGKHEDAARGQAADGGIEGFAHMLREGERLGRHDWEAWKAASSSGNWAASCSMLP